MHKTVFVILSLRVAVIDRKQVLILIHVELLFIIPNNNIRQFISIGALAYCVDDGHIHVDQCPQSRNSIGPAHLSPREVREP